MKKLLLLFTALLLTSCSSDDDTTQNFLEKYDGIYWALNDNDEGYFWLQFNLTNFVQCDYVDVDACYCDSVSWGATFDNGTVSVKENGPEKLIITFSAQVEDIALSYDLNIKTINDGNGIEVSYPAGFEDVNGSTETFTRFNSEPCN